MLSYGDVVRAEPVDRVRRSIAGSLEAVIEARPGRERHELLVRAFIETGELVQGLADQEFEAAGADDVSERQTAGACLLLAQARAILHSWKNGFGGTLHLPPAWRAELDRLESAEPVSLKRGEGYAFYALYPECYLEAARRSGLNKDTMVIGLRSIGTGLSALVAAALGARPPFSLRPTGHPFDRRVAVAPALAAEILRHRDAAFAIVDEGPGLSGSSFGCVADWLVAQGIPADRIHFFPSHSGQMGPQASSAHRSYWQTRPRHTLEVDQVLLSSTAGGKFLPAWASSLVGGDVEAWRDISGGAWRAIHDPDETNWPPSHAAMEKRKFLMRSEERRFLVKFAGLDALAHQKSRRGRILAEAGFVPRSHGFAYGFTVDEWVAGKPLDPDGFHKDEVIDHVGRYLGFRARYLAAPNGGASLSDLCSMSIVNTGEALGEVAAGRVRAIASDAGRFSRRLRRVDTDNRLHAWEWLVSEDGALLKTDGLDHNAAHDFIGCQDIAWDIAGAAVEFGLSAAERGRLAKAVAREADVDPREEVLDIFELCYLAFQIGLWTNAVGASQGSERDRIGHLVRRYSGLLETLLES